jgi:hypothetical protein
MPGRVSDHDLFIAEYLQGQLHCDKPIAAMLTALTLIEQALLTSSYEGGMVCAANIPCKMGAFARFKNESAAGSEILEKQQPLMLRVCRQKQETAPLNVSAVDQSAHHKECFQQCRAQELPPLHKVELQTFDSYLGEYRSPAAGSAIVAWLQFSSDHIISSEANVTV